MNLKHTPGPWKVYDFTEKGVYSLAVGPIESLKMITLTGTCIHSLGVDRNNIFVSDEDEANAKLIAAAPEMLDALIYFVKRVHDGSIRSRTTYSKYVDIIEKATGMSIDEVLK